MIDCSDMMSQVSRACGERKGAMATYLAVMAAMAKHMRKEGGREVATHNAGGTTDGNANFHCTTILSTEQHIFEARPSR